MSAKFDLILKGGTVVTHETMQVCDIAISDGKISQIGSLGNGLADQIVDCTGLHILAGVIDTQVHFREPGLTHKEDLESGSRAAVMGGVTTFFDEPNVIPTTTSASALSEKISLAQGRSWANFAFWVGASTDNLDQLEELEGLDGTPELRSFHG